MLFYIINSIFFLGLSGLYLNRKHIIVLLLALELIFLSINLNIVYTIVNLDLLVIFYRIRGGISLDFIKLLKG